MLTVTLQAVRNPGQVQPGQQRQVVQALVLQGHRVERRVAKQKVAVHRHHQRRGVGHQQGGGGGFGGAAGLFQRNTHLFFGPRCAARGVTPYA